MLKLFRQRKTAVRALLFAIVGIVGFMMVVTLVPSLGQVDRSLRDPQGTLARVGEASLTRPEVEREYQRRVRQLGVDSSQFRQLILQGLIRDLIAQRVAEYEAQQLGLKATDEEIRLQSRQFDVLYPGGKFVGQAAYQQVLQQNFGMNVHEFEQQLRRQTLLTKLFLWVTAGVTVTPAEVEQEYRRRNEQAKIEFVVFRPETLAATLTPTEEELQTYYGHNRERYQVPERRAVRFVAIDNEELHRRVSVSAEELERYYRSHRDDYRQPERVHARHILFLKPAQTAATEAAAPEDNPLRKKAEQVLAQLLRGADFAALARKNSEHAESRDKGGDLGWVQRGQTVEALDRALFTLKPSAAAALIETPYGFHIVQVLEHQPEHTLPLAAVRSDIERLLKEERVQQEGVNQARAIVDAVRGGKTLDAAAREARWGVQESPRFTRTETLPAFGRSTDFQEAAFRLPAASAGQPAAPASEPVSVPAGYAILQLKEVLPAHAASFEEVQAEVARAYRQEQAATRAREAAQKLAADAQAKGDLRAAARAARLEVTTSEKFGRLGMLPGLGSVREIAAQAFSLPVGRISQPVLVGANWVVFRVVERAEVDPSKMPAPEKETITNSLRDQKRSLAWSLFVETVKKRLEAEGKLTINNAAISRLTGES